MVNSHSPEPIEFCFDFLLRAHCDYDRRENVMDIWFTFETPSGEVIVPPEVEAVIVDDLDTMTEIELNFRRQIDAYFEE